MADEKRGGRPAERLVAAIALSVAASLVIGWLALLISQANVSPAILFPIAVGAAVGACQGMIFRRLDLSPPLAMAVVVGLALGLLAVATEDYAGYRDYLRQYAKAREANPLAAAADVSEGHWNAISFGEYLIAIVRRDPLWWSIDVALTALAAGGVALAIARQTKVGRQTGETASE